MKMLISLVLAATGIASSQHSVVYQLAQAAVDAVRQSRQTTRAELPNPSNTQMVFASCQQLDVWAVDSMETAELSAVACPQDQDGGTFHRSLTISTGNMATPRFFLLMRPDVVKELKLTEQQQKKVRDVLQVTAVEGGSGEQTIMVSGMNIDQDLDEQCKAILTASQQARLLGIYMQLEGYRAALLPELVKALKITDKQKQKIESVCEKSDSETEALLQGINFESQNVDVKEIVELEKKTKAIKEKRDQQLVAILTKDQIATWNKLKGTKFEETDSDFSGGHSLH